MMTRLLTCLTLAISFTVVRADEGAIPKIFDGFLIKGLPTKAQIGNVVPPTEIDKYVAKVAAAKRKNQEWFKEFEAKSEQGVPLPYHENLGLTKEEYDDYLKLWSQRDFKASEEVMLLLREGSDNTWIITATGKAGTLSTLRYNPSDDTYRSPNGKMARIDDITAPAASALGAWTGKEWRLMEETSLGATKENIALGRTTDGKYGMIVYRIQELTSSGTRLLDKSLFIRFALPKKKP